MSFWRFISVTLCTLLLLVICLLVPTTGQAQGSARNSDVDDPAMVSLSIWLDRNGGAMVGVSSDGFPPGTLPMEPFCKALGGPIVPMDSDDIDREEWQILGHCDGMFHRRGGLRQGSIDLRPLQQLMRAHNVRWLNLSILQSSQPFMQVSGAKRIREPGSRSVYYCRMIDLDNTVQVSQPVTIAYGYGRRDIARIVLPLVFVLLAAVGLTLWMRTQALRAEDRAARAGKSIDPAVVWFGYGRFLQSLTVGIWIAWVPVVIATHASDFVEFLIGGSWLTHSGLPLFLLYIPALVIIGCFSLSHPVFARVRGLEYTRTEMVRQAAWGQSRLLPLICLINGAQELSIYPKLAVAWFAGAFLLNILTLQGAMKSMGLTPQALMSGPLRERVFALASKARVPLRQVYMLPAGKGRLANAFASVGNNVLLTDYLLQSLNKREVDAVVAHELTHLKRRHPQMLQGIFLLIFIAAAVLAGYTEVWTSLSVVSGVTYGLLASIGLFLAYSLSRRFEWQADAGAVSLTGDAEAMITGLAKISSLNLTPLQWGKWQGKWLTHPQTIQRMQRMGQAAGLSSEQVQNLAQLPEFPEQDYYSFPPPEPDDMVFSTRRKSKLLQSLSWISLLGTPTLAAAVVMVASAAPSSQAAILLLGIPLAVCIPQLLIEIFQQRRYAHLERLLCHKMEAEGSLQPGERADFVAYSPGPFPRVYEGFYDWDIGFLQMKDRHLCYYGEKTRFALASERIIDMVIREDTPSLWRRWPRLYLRWSDGKSPDAAEDPDLADDPQNVDPIFNLRLGAAGSVWHSRQASQSMLHKLVTWRTEMAASPLQDFEPHMTEILPLRENVTALSPKQYLTLRVFNQSLITSIGFAVSISILFGLTFDLASLGISDSEVPMKIAIQRCGGWYVVLVTLLALIANMIPLWRYRDKR